MTEYDKMTRAELIEELKINDRLLSSAHELLSSLNVAILGVSLEGTISSWNRGAENIYGYSAGEIIGQNVTILSPPDRHQEVLGILARIRGGTHLKNYETVRVTKEGRQINLSLDISPIINSAGEITGASTIARDITRHKQKEQNLTKLASFLMLSPHPIMEVDLDGKVSFANPAARRLFPDLVLLGSAHPWLADWESLVAPCRDRRKNPKDREVAVAGRWYHQTMCYVLEEKLLRIYGFDITERKRVEEALGEKTEELDRYFNNALDLLCIAETDGIFHRLNLQWESTLGFSVSELEGRRFLDFVHPDDVDASLHVHSRLDGQKEVLNFVNRFRCKNGSYRWIEWSSFQLGTCIYGVGRDITERKRVENELRQTERRIRILNQIANVFLTVPDEGIYADVLEVVLDAMASEFGFFGFIADNGDFVIPSMTREIWNECLVSDKTITFPQGTWGDSVWGKAINEKKSFLSNGAFRIPEGHIPIRHFLTTPIVFGEKSIGLLAVANREGGYTEEDRYLLESIAYSVSPVLNARMQRDRQEKDRMLAEEALRESELRYREVYENSSECIFLLDVTADGRFKFAGFNPAEEKTVGYSSSEVSGKFVEEAVPAEVVCQVIENYRRCLASGTIINYEEQLDLPVGRRNFRTVLIPVRNVAGDIYRILGVSRDITDTIQAERQLQQSNDLLRAIIQAAPTAIIGLDLNGNVQTVWNPAAEKMLGWSAREVIGQPLPSVLVESQQEFRSFREMIRGSMNLNGVEVRRQRRDGTLIDYSIYASPLHNPEGDITGNVAVLVDITERKRMEEELRLAHDELEKRVVERTEQLERTAEALRTSEERYALAVQGSNDGIWDINLATGEIYFSPRWKSMLGYEDNEIPNNSEEWKKRIHPDDRQKVFDTREAYLEGLISTYEIEYRLRHKDGSFRWIYTRGTCLRDSGEKPIRFVGSHSDITDRKRMEGVLRESEKKYRTLFEESKDAIFISDPARCIIDINQAGIELFGYTKEELYSLDLERLYCNPEDRMVLWQKLFVSGYVNDFAVEMKRRNGEKIIVHLSMSAIKDDAGRVSGYQGIIHDMTERKKLERQLLQSQKMESVGILAGGVAHDFNNLLTAISGYGQILQERIPDDDELAQESIRNVLHAANRAAELTKGLLAFSRKQLISPKPIQIDNLISDAGKLIQRIIGEDIELSTNFSGENRLVKADPGQIEHVLMNLATNARDAMPHGGHLSITTRQVVIEEGSEILYDLPSPGEYAMISVTDTGTGIDKKTLESIFEPFYTTKEVGKGTGLGLAIVHGIIKQHNGSVLARSQPGKGTTFDIYLPLVEGLAAKEESIISAPHFKGTETLLVVEDDETVRMFMRKILARAGYKVIIASNGEDAVAQFREHDDISLVLSDLVMPRKNGKEMLDEIRMIKPGIKAVFISGYAADVMQKKGISEEGTELITKPFQKNDLLQKVREVLDKD